MTKKIKLDIISDIVCPWCIIGYNRLKVAIDELQLNDKIDIEWQPFELNPDMPAEGEPLREHVARKYGASRADSDSARENISKLGAEHNFIFNYSDETKMVNTLDAHILLDLAENLGKQTELKLRLFTAFFTEGKDISLRDVLLAESDAIGIDRAKAEQALADTSNSEKIRAIETQWHSMGVSSVPTVVFNRTSALTGAQSVEAYKQVLSQLLAEQN
ncbi:DsbA family oxidoreductase [Colwellia sp. E2M01]|uniref:DsbA family oxidoreductase n=1 Tax=Colwellia sp. E2M01 TaxID=2841561 RepID=UPI001C096D62|nr:DsbA family oxidoreductase [Colwellia sp. E2M01]MBU2871858.1 DsbA family oxidoreductase [Colwellia sp. E2M01]